MQEYLDISNFFDAAMGDLDQIPKGLPTDFALRPKCAGKGCEPVRRAFQPDRFVI